MTLWLDDGDVRFYHGDAAAVLATLDPGVADCVVTSPPYWGLRDYGGGALELGTESTIEAYVDRLVAVFDEAWRVLRPDGVVWLNLGDTYATGHRGDTRSGFNARYHGNGAPGKQAATPGQLPAARVPDGLKPKDLCGAPWRVAFALQAAGWYLRADVVWSKPNAMPEPVRDRPTRSHEYLFLLARSARYHYDADAIREPHHPDGRTVTTRTSRDGSHPNYGEFDHAEGRQRWPNGGRNARSVWDVPAQASPDAHFATYPEALVRRCILAGSRPGGLVVDPFVGSGTTAWVARTLGRRAIGVDLSDTYLRLAADRCAQQSLLSGGA